MHPPENELTRIYRDFSDEELLRRWRSGSLTEAAQKIALEEMAARGISPPPVAAQQENTAAKAPVGGAPMELATVATFSTPFPDHVCGRVVGIALRGFGLAVVGAQAGIGFFGKWLVFYAGVECAGGHQGCATRGAHGAAETNGRD